MNDLFQLFNFLSSDSEAERNQAYQTFEKLFQDPAFYNLLFQILSMPNLEQKYYILTSNCLLTWFRRNIIKKEEQNAFIQKLQSFLLVNHPAQKQLFTLYTKSFAIYDSDSYFTFLGNSINLISLETPPEILVCILKLASKTSKYKLTSLKNNINEYCNHLFTEINNRLIPILQNAEKYLSFSTGCIIIKYTYKIFFFSLKKEQIILNVALIPLIYNSLQMILNNIPHISDQNFYKLVKFSRRIIDMFQLTIKNSVVKRMKLPIEQEQSFLNNIYLLIINFTAALAPFHTEIVNHFLKLLYLHINIVPESQDFFRVFIEVCTLTKNDLSDFYTNPSVFYEYAYSSTFKSNRRRTCFDIVNCKANKSITEAFLRIIMLNQPTEPTMYLISSIIHGSISLEMDEEVSSWIMNCYKEQIPFRSPLEMSTFLYLVSKASSRILPDEFLLCLAPLVCSITVLSVQNNLPENQQQPFAVSCSKSLVTVTNAVRVARKILDKRIFEFPVEMLVCVIQLLPVFPAPDGAGFVRSFIQTASDNPQKEAFVRKHIEIIKNNLCISAFQTLSTAVAIEMSNDKKCFKGNQNINEYSILSKTLSTLDDVISCEGPTPNITEQMLALIESSLANLDQDFSQDLVNLIVTILKTGIPESRNLIFLVLKSINDCPSLITQIDTLYEIFISFMVLFHNEFVEMHIAPLIVETGIKAINSNYCQEGTDLICFSIQSDQSFDCSSLFAFINEQVNIVPDFFNDFGILIIMSIIISRNQEIPAKNEIFQSIIQWVSNNNAKCPYEKRLAALSLMKLNICDDVMKLVIQIVSQEKDQREKMMKGKLPECHYYPTPVDSINIAEVMKMAVQRCSDNNKQYFLNCINQLFA